MTTKNITDHILIKIDSCVDHNLINIRQRQLFDYSEDSVQCEFIIKGIPKWKWGIRVVPQENNTFKVSIFGEHEWYIDKFKPNNTEISQEYIFSGDNNLDRLNWVFHDMFNTINLIYSYPIFGLKKIYFKGGEYPNVWLIKEWFNNSIKLPINKWLEITGNGILCKIYKSFLRHTLSKQLKIECDECMDDFVVVYPRFVLRIIYPNYWDINQIKHWYHRIPKFKSFGNNIRVVHRIQEESYDFYIM